MTDEDNPTITLEFANRWQRRRFLKQNGLYPIGGRDGERINDLLVDDIHQVVVGGYYDDD